MYIMLMSGGGREVDQRYLTHQRANYRFNSAATPNSKNGEPRVKQRKPNLLKRTLTISLITVLIITIASATLFVIRSRASHTPLDKYKEALDFSLYYPSPLPTGYKLKDGSIKLYNNILFYSLEKAESSVDITLQKNLQDNKSISRIDGFTAANINAGTMYTGSAAGNSVAIINAGKTLISISTTGDVDPGDFGRIMQKLKY